MVFLHSFSKPDMKTWLVVPEGEEIIHPGDYTSSAQVSSRNNSQIARVLKSLHQKSRSYY